MNNAPLLSNEGLRRLGTEGNDVIKQDWKNDGEENQRKQRLLMMLAG